MSQEKIKSMVDNIVNGIIVNDKPNIKKAISSEYKYTFHVNNESMATAPIKNDAARHLYNLLHHNSLSLSSFTHCLCPSSIDLILNLFAIT